jgi:tetratricopeptide (TPR) repeat protein
LLAKAREHESKGDHNAAEIELKNAVQKAPNHAQARVQIGEFYYRTGNLETAGKELDLAIDLGADAAKVMPTLGRIWLRRGQHEKVLAEVVVTQKEPEEPPEILVIRGGAYAALGRVQDAKRVYALALSKRPGYHEALLGQARLSAAANDAAGALKLADAALAKEPKFADALVFKADLLRTSGKAAEAVTLYRDAIALQASDLTPRVNLVSALLDQGKVQEAQREIDAARKLAPKHLSVAFAQAMLYNKAGQYAQSEEAVQLILRVMPAHVPSLVLSGSNQLALGQPEGAVAALSTAVAKAPQNLAAHKLLAAAYLANNQAQRAYDMIEAALARAPNDAQLLALGAEALTQVNQPNRAMAALDPSKAAVQPRSSQSADGAAAETLERQLGQDAPKEIAAQIARGEYDAALKAIEALQEKQPNSPIAPNLRGVAHIGKKDVAAARQDFERALKIDANFFPAISNLALLDAVAKQPEAAKRRLQALLEKDKKHLGALLALARLNWQFGDKAQALELARRAQSGHPQSGAALDMLGQLELANGRAEAALAAFTKRVEVERNSPLAHFRLAGVQAALGKLAPAAQSLKNALELKPDFIDAMIALAAIHAREGRHGEAQQVARHVQQRFPKSATGFLVEGDSLLREKKAAEAARALQRAYELEPAAAVVVKLHQAHVAAGAAAKGQAVAEEWLKRHPDDLVLNQYLAQRSLTEGDFTAAARRYEIVLKQQPANAAVLNNYAWTLAQLKRPNALEYAEKAYAVSGDNPSVMDTVGVLALEAGKTERALKLLRSATQLAPQAVEIRYHFAQALVKSGAKEEARKELEQVLEAGKQFPELAAARKLLAELR